MALESKATPEDRFNAWLAEQAPAPVRRSCLQRAGLLLWGRVAALIGGRFFCAALLWSLAANVRQLLQALQV